jgi:hypothetical protein
MQALPAAADALLMVPAPTMLPAHNDRVRARCAMIWPKSKITSVLAWGSPRRWPLTCADTGRSSMAPAQCEPRAAGVTAMGAKLLAGLLW